MDYASMTETQWREYHAQRFDELVAARDAAVAELRELTSEQLRRKEAEIARLRAEIQSATR